MFQVKHSPSTGRTYCRQQSDCGSIPSMTQHGYDFQQLKFRDRQNGGLEWDATRYTADKQLKERVRSKPDKRLFEAMTVDQETAFVKIQAAHSIMNSGLGAKIQRYDDGGKVTGSGDVESGAVLLGHYRAWREMCQKRGISGLMAEDVIIWGDSPHASDVGRKMAHGTAKKNLLACLDAWWLVDRHAVKASLKMPLDGREGTKA